MYEKHGLTKTRLYRIWSGMRTRCNFDYPRNHDYHGRGITICDEWQSSFMAFANWAYSHGYNDDLSIDRIDVNGNYEPSNCRWATPQQQIRNQRIKNSNKSGYKGVCYDPVNEKWIASITVNYSHIKLGRFVHIADAIEARQKAEAQFFAERR